LYPWAIITKNAELRKGDPSFLLDFYVGRYKGIALLKVFGYIWKTMKRLNPRLRSAFLFVVIPVFLSLALLSCDIPVSNINTGTLRPLGENEFYAQDFVTGRYYILTADILAYNDYSTIWVERGSGITFEQAQKIADEYAIIRRKIVDTFGMKNFIGRNSGRHFDDILDYANWLAGRNDGRLTILLLDIRDGWQGPQDAYIAGYFFSGDFFPPGRIQGTNHYSNGRDMIYIDTFPGLEINWERALSTIAHELVHLINFVTAVQMDQPRMMDLWIDEGLASQAEYIHLGGNPEDRIEWFVRDPLRTISRGNNFFVWGNHVGRQPLAILDDYATVYLFFRWLFLQAQARLEPDLYTRFFYNMVTSEYHDHRIVTSLARQINPAWEDWDVLLKTWLAANFYPDNPVFGYKDDDIRNELRVRPIYDLEFIPLYPGEGVFSRIDSPFTPPPETGINIHYVGLTPDEISSSNSFPITGEVMLTFNANTNHTRPSERGFLTNASPSSTARLAEEPQPPFTGPFVIDARDMFGRDGERELSDSFFRHWNQGNEVR